MRFAYTEMITADVSKGILRLFTVGKDNIFNEAYTESYNGFLFTNDLTLPYSVGAYETFIANNKNAYLSFQAQQDYTRENVRIAREQNLANAQMGVASGVGMGIGNVASGNLIGGISNFQQAGMSAINGVVNDYFMQERGELQLAYNQTQFDLTIDNMKNAPDTLANANGNAIFIAAVAEFGLYAELYAGLDTELESANDIMFRDGYSLNRFEESGKTIKDYCHTRKYFNYIKAVLGNIRGVPMSDTMRADLRKRFANGIRFWHQDAIDYSMENYELTL